MGDEEENKLNCSLTNDRNMEISIAEASSMFPGFRFSPTDEELISFYLKKKIEGLDNCVEVIPEVDICRYEPWDLPGSLLTFQQQYIYIYFYVSLVLKFLFLFAFFKKNLEEIFLRKMRCN